MRSLCTMNPVSMRQRAVAVDDPVGVGVAAEPVVGLEQGHVRGPRGDVGSGQPGDAGADDGDPAGAVVGVHQAQVSKLKRATGSEVGTGGAAGGLDGDAGARGVRDVALEHDRRCRPPVISPAGTIPLSASSSHSS